MTIKSKFQKGYLMLRYPRLLLKKNNYIFILSHMRSRSSLLSHILGSHKEIFGYGELHYSYPTERSLIKMHVEISKDLGVTKREGYFLDKLLHNSFELPKQFYDKENVYLLILAREPVATLKSIVQMGKLTGDSGYLDVDRMLTYYINRVSFLLDVVTINNTIVLDSDSITERSNATLVKLEKWLGLASPLTEEYNHFKKTGAEGHGDPSSNIKAGTIVKTKNELELEFDKNKLREAQTLFQRLIEHSV